MSQLLAPSFDDVRKNWKVAYPGGYDTILPAGAASRRPARGMESIDLRSLGILPGVAGGAPVHGIQQVSDVLTQLADGTPLNNVWDDFMALLNVTNSSRQAIINFLSFNVTNETETVAQPGDGVDFEDMTELGVPVASRVQPTYFQLGYSFKWYDLGSRFSWQFLADATQAQVDSVANAAVESYWRKLMVELMKTLFNNVNTTATIRGNSYNVYRFYNADGTVPPAYKTNTFTGSHTHYVGSGATTVNSGDLDEIIDDFASHGYTTILGYTLALLVNRIEGDIIRGFRTAANGGTARYDFLQASNQPGQIINRAQEVLGQGPPATSLRGLAVIGSYGPLIIVQDDWFPSGYIVGVATGGENSLNNPLGIRQHRQQALQGLRLVRGRQPDYPLIDSYWATGFGFGARQRGGAYVMKMTAGSYAAPAIYS
jgi:hypothetical protein